MLTEEEARKKWCPFVRFANGGNRAKRAHETASSLSSTNRCIASECMAWRWAEMDKRDDLSLPVKTRIRNGHCGLAGNPQG